jgi:hypothetical protein
MADPKDATATQLRNIEESSGKKLADFVKLVKAAGVDKHGEIIKFLKTKHGMTHGNANLIAHLVRQELAGGPADTGDLLAAQYAGGKAGLRPIYDKLAAIAEGMGGDVQKVIQKTGVSFRRKKQFALVQAPSAKRVQLGLNFKKPPSDKRIAVMGGMCTHKVDIEAADAVDAGIEALIRAAYDQAS